MPTLANKTLAPPFTKDEILAYLKELKAELEKDGIVELGLFGSYAKGTANASSDIDIFIRTSDEFYQKFRGFKAAIFLGELRESIENHFGLSTDLCNLRNYDDEKRKNFFKGAIYVW